MNVFIGFTRVYGTFHFLCLNSNRKDHISKFWNMTIQHYNFLYLKECDNKSA